MTTELSRLVSIIEYAQQSARMKASPAASVTSHDLFPAIKSKILKPWLELTQEPYTTPKLRQVVSGQSLIAAGTHRKFNQTEGLTEEQAKLPKVDQKSTINLGEYQHSGQVRADFFTDQSQLWNHWSEHEKTIRETIALYSKLFTLKQQFDSK